MKHHWLAAFLCIVFALAATGCGNSPKAGSNKRRYATPQTGSNLPRWTAGTNEKREQRAKQRKAKESREKREAKKPKPEKPKRERSGRAKRAADDEVITRGGFR